jgi:hypothetical protein
MRMAQLVPATIKAFIKGSIRYRAIRRALRPLQLRGKMSDDELRAFHKAWGNTGFSADPAYLAKLLELLTAGPVLECGTGGTTLLENLAGIRRGFKTYCLEQDPEWARPIREWQLESVEIDDAPLKDYGGYYWYDAPTWLPEHFKLVVCDGPYIDKALGEPYYAAWRYGVLRWLKETGRTFDVLLLDDAGNSRAPGILTRWEQEFGVEVQWLRSADGELALVYQR